MYDANDFQVVLAVRVTLNQIMRTLVNGLYYNKTYCVDPKHNNNLLCN